MQVEKQTLCKEAGRGGGKAARSEKQEEDEK